MRVIIQCAGSKRKDAGRLVDPAGREVIFVARPELCQNVEPSIRYCRPDDEIGPGLGTWRAALARYNQDGQNPSHLSRAADLYRPNVYRDLVEAFGWENVFVLSAGWGLIRSDFLTADYDITFSNQGTPWSRRNPRRTERWQDFNQLGATDVTPGEANHFFGGKSYLPLFFRLTRHLSGDKVVHHKGRVLSDPAFSYESYVGLQKQNWHYPAAQAFIRANKRNVAEASNS